LNIAVALMPLPAAPAAPDAPALAIALPPAPAPAEATVPAPLFAMGEPLVPADGTPLPPWPAAGGIGRTGALGTPLAIEPARPALVPLIAGPALMLAGAASDAGGVSALPQLVQISSP
jgi:hypothetical protein